VGGSCHGGDPVVCDDQCASGGGACDPLTGLCGGTRYPTARRATTGTRVRTRTRVWQAPARAAPGRVRRLVHGGGICDPATGLCGGDEMPDGAPCDDGNACTRVDSCSGGTCTGGDPVVCEGCSSGGTCDPLTGVCTGHRAARRHPCEDGNHCTDSDTCSGGACVAGPARQCTAGPATRRAAVIRDGRLLEPAQVRGTLRRRRSRAPPGTAAGATCARGAAW
jgi:hypothetical protein